VAYSIVCFKNRSELDSRVEFIDTATSGDRGLKAGVVENGGRIRVVSIQLYIALLKDDALMSKPCRRR
jgi:hypothetical protein